jgi:uncharacterized protein (DUF58 family)
VKPPAAAFAGSSTLLEVVVSNPGGVRHGLGFGVKAPRAERSLAWAEVEGHGLSSVVVACAAAQRGHLELPLLRVESRFPFGLFCAWSVWRPAGRRWVYPAPEQPAPPLPAAQAEAGAGSGHRASAAGEFEGVRPWRRGDSLRQVVWKKMARTGELVSRDGRETDRRQLWLDWQIAAAPDSESRLSRLCAWVLAAEADGRAFGLRLPGTELPMDDGPAQREQALQRLALHPGGSTR